MEIKKIGEVVVWWRTRDTSATCHNRLTVTCERHPLKSPRFSRSYWYLNRILSNENIFNFDKSASSAIPIFNDESSKWELICPIGDCNMDIEKNEDNGEEILKFRVSVQAAKSESTIFTIEEVGPLFIGPISGILRATCVYKSVIRKG